VLVPFIQVTMIEGRTVEQKRALIAGIAHAAVEALDVPLDRVRVAIYEVQGDDWGIGDKTYAEVRGAVTPPPASDPAITAEDTSGSEAT
jgi:4-oxalocrotonate tautomerase